ncbi:MAG: phosphatase PAP2 family protein [Patescibacteria group bacterium]
MKKFATILSKIFDPMVGMAVVLLLALLRSGVSWAATFFWLFILIGPSIVMRVWAWLRHGLDWDIKDRRRRIVPFFILLVMIACDLVLLTLFAPVALFRLFLFFFVWTAGFFLITVFATKISGHAAGNALAAGLIILWYGWQWWPILLIVPLVGWARVVRRDHTVGQVIVGVLYSWSILLLFY